MSNVHQKHAISTFTVMLERALKYRENPNDNDTDFFYPDYGICDNIGRCSPHDADVNIMSLIKDNVIRRLPSYSGNYHYPVLHPSPRDGKDLGDEAENAYCEFSNKWADGYGAERVQQLRELLDHVTNNWDDSFVTTLSPAMRVGIIKDITVVQRKSDGELYTLQYDDGSCDPYFKPLGGTEDDRRSIDLRKIRIIPMEEQPKRSVSGFLKAIDKTIAKRVALEAKLNALRAQIDTLTREEVVLDYNLGKQHNVKRLVKK